MKTVGYLRISTDGQDIGNQKHSMIDLQIDCFVEEAISGKVTWKDRKLGTLVRSLECGDTLIVSELSRLGRSFYEVMELLSVLTKKGIRLHSVKENFDLSDNIQSKVVAFAFSLAAEIERQLISQRTKEALALKKSQGVVLGRPMGKKDSKEGITSRRAKIKARKEASKWNQS